MGAISRLSVGFANEDVFAVKTLQPGAIWVVVWAGDVGLAFEIVSASS
jgi:hypothetical protein